MKGDIYHSMIHQSQLSTMSNNRAHLELDCSNSDMGDLNVWACLVAEVAVLIPAMKVKVIAICNWYPSGISVLVLGN